MVAPTPFPTPQLVLDFVAVKDGLLASFGQSNDAMHVHVGLALFVPLWLALGRRAWWLPLALLALVSLVAEVFDVIALTAVTAPADPYESLRDVGNTLAWPAVFTLILWRWRRGG